jgi:hypothetical protein
MALTKEQDDAIFSAFLGIGVLRTMCRAAKLPLGEARAKDLQLELDTAFPGLAARSALRCGRRAYALSNPCPADTETIKLSAEDWDVLARALKEPPEPNEKLKRLMRARKMED